MTDGPEIPSGVAMLCTGLAMTEPTATTEFEDPVLGRRIAHGYALRELAGESARTISQA